MSPQGPADRILALAELPHCNKLKPKASGAVVVSTANKILRTLIARWYAGEPWVPGGEDLWPLPLN